MTGAVSNGTYASPNLTPGAADTIRITVKPVRSQLLKQIKRKSHRVKKWLKRSYTISLTSTSQADATARDVAKVKVLHK